MSGNRQPPPHAGLTPEQLRPRAKGEAITAAEQFLAATAEAVHPDLPATVLLDYAARYRAHLSAVLAAAKAPIRDQARGYAEQAGA